MSPDAIAVPERIGKYPIRRVLGSGAMGTVYEAYDPLIERSVAIKTILAEHITSNTELSALARFKREAQAAGRLQHPGIVSVYEYGEQDGIAFIVMEYVAGKPLRELMREPLERIDTYEVMKQLLAALEYSHRHGVVHRDIKPANVMVLDGFKIKIMDFGVARIESSSITQVGMFVGTPTHISPEELIGSPTDGRADLWSAGVVLYELLTGRAPFAADTPATVIHQILHIDPPTPSSVGRALPPIFDVVLARALAKNADERFQSAREFANALASAFIKSLPTATAAETSAPGQIPGAATADAELSGSSLKALLLRPHMLAEIEGSLARSVGPVAGHLVRQSLLQATTIEAFVSLLVENVPEGVDRDAFRRHIQGLNWTRQSLPSDQVFTPVTVHNKQAFVFDPATLAAAEKRLAHYIGPLAKVLIKRAADDSGDVSELYNKLAEHIDANDERVAFISTLR